MAEFTDEERERIHRGIDALLAKYGHPRPLRPENWCPYPGCACGYGPPAAATDLGDDDAR